MLERQAKSRLFQRLFGLISSSASWESYRVERCVGAWTLGTKDKLSQYDVYKDKATGRYYVMGKGGTDEPQPITPKNGYTLQ